MGQFHATAHIRLLLPLRHPRFGEGYEVSAGLQFPDEQFDVVIAERVWHSGVTVVEAERMVRAIRPRCRLFLYSIDDNLLDLGADEEDGTAPLGPGERAAVRFFARVADGLIVSTEAIKDRFRALNDRIVVIGNALDDRLFPDIEENLVRRLADSRTDAPTKFGYVGTATHLKDFMVVVEPIRQILRHFRAKIEFELAGVVADPRVLRLFTGLPVTSLNVESTDYYPGFVRWASNHLDWDFGIAPLSDTPLNRSKSDIKFLDYSLLGIPGVYSNMPAYRRSVQHLKTGLVVSNNPNDWRSALELIISKPEVRAKMALNAYREVRADRTLDHQAHEWRKAIDIFWEEAACQQAVSAS